MVRIGFRLWLCSSFVLLRTVSVNLAEGEHLAQFVTEFFSDYGQASEMQGMLTVESDRGVVAATIRQSFDSAIQFPDFVPTLTIFPVVPNRADAQ